MQMFGTFFAPPGLYPVYTMPNLSRYLVGLTCKTGE